MSDPTANGTLHWAPLHDNGLRERMRVIAEWVSAVQPEVMVVDVSVEVAMLVRLLGVPVVVMAMPGDRTDAPHDLVYRAAEHIVAPWPQELYEPPWLQEHSAKTTYVGGISRFDGRAPDPSPPDPRVNLLVLNGAGGSSVDATIRKAVRRYASAIPLDGSRRCGRPVGARPVAGVVRRRCGDLLGGYRAPWQTSPQRSTGDHHSLGAAIRTSSTPRQRALERGRLAVIQHGWPEPRGLAIARRSGTRVRSQRWQRWATRGAAARAAAAIERVARTCATTTHRENSGHDGGATDERHTCASNWRAWPGCRPGGSPRGGGDRRR